MIFSARRLWIIVLLGVFFFARPFSGFADSSLSESAESTEPQGKADPRIVLHQLRFDTQEELEESRRLLESALAFDPGNADYHFELSRVYGALYDESLRGPSVSEPYLLDRSQNQLEQVLMIRPEDIPAHYNLGVIYKRREKMEQARAAFRRVIYLNEKNGSSDAVSGSAWLQIGSIYEEQGFFDDARDAYVKAREIGGNRPEVQDALRDLSEKQHQEFKTPPPRADSWTREYVSGADYAQFGRDALRGRSQRAGLGALVPITGHMLIEQFMNRRRQVERD